MNIGNINMKNTEDRLAAIKMHEMALYRVFKSFFKSLETVSIKHLYDFIAKIIILYHLELPYFNYMLFKPITI
jgi:hypothetical protein